MAVNMQRRPAAQQPLGSPMHLGFLWNLFFLSKL